MLKAITSECPTGLKEHMWNSISIGQTAWCTCRCGRDTIHKSWPPGTSFGDCWASSSQQLPVLSITLVCKIDHTSSELEHMGKRLLLHKLARFATRVKAGYKDVTQTSAQLPRQVSHKKWNEMSIRIHHRLQSYLAAEYKHCQPKTGTYQPINLEPQT